MPIIEPQDRQVARGLHKEVATDLEQLMITKGWQRLAEYLDREIASAFNMMQMAKNGDEAIRSSVAYTIMTNLRRWPETVGQESINRLMEMDKEDAEEKSDAATNRSRNRRNIP